MMNDKQKEAFAKLYPTDALVLNTPDVRDTTLQKARLKLFTDGWQACEAALASSEPVREAIQTIKSNSLQGGDAQLYTHPAPSKDAEFIKAVENMAERAAESGFNHITIPINIINKK